jgi:magnesium-transporting ATPase (P-type)
LSFFSPRYSIHNSDRLHRHPEPINRLTEKENPLQTKETKKKIKSNQINKYKKKRKEKTKPKKNIFKNFNLIFFVVVAVVALLFLLEDFFYLFLSFFCLKLIF